MTRFQIELSEEDARQLEELAEKAGMTSEELLRAGIQEWLSQPQSDFLEAATYVLHKNAELYRRLA